MKTTRTIRTAGATAAATLLLASCSTSAAETTTPATRTDAAASPSSTPSPTPEPATVTPTPSASAETSPSHTPSPSRSISARGNLIKAPGVEAGFRAPDGTDLVEFTVHSLAVDQPCTSSSYIRKPAANGHFVFIDMTVTTTKALDDYTATMPPWFELADGWGAFAKNGQVMAGSPLTEAARLCLKPSQMLPEAVDPGRTVRGIIVLDVPTKDGYVTFHPLRGEDGGWEWAYPAS